MYDLSLCWVVPRRAATSARSRPTRAVRPPSPIVTLLANSELSSVDIFKEAEATNGDIALRTTRRCVFHCRCRDDFIDRVMDNPRLNANPKVDEAHHRVSRAGFKYYVTEMVCWATGGPQKYSGRSMLESHAHQGSRKRSGKCSWPTSAHAWRNLASPRPNKPSFSRSWTAQRRTSSGRRAKGRRYRPETRSHGGATRVSDHGDHARRELRRHLEIAKAPPSWPTSFHSVPGSDRSRDKIVGLCPARVNWDSSHRRHIVKNATK